MSTNVGEIDLSLILNSDKFSSQLNNIDAQANKASTKISSSLSKIGKAAIAAFSVTAIVKFGKTCLDVATQTSNAWIGLNSILTGQGKSFEKAKSFINEYISDGLVPLNNAVTTYKNLAARGYNSDQIKNVMNALKNSATFGRQSAYTLGEAVQTASEGLKNENSILVDNAGVTKNVAKMWEDYAKSIGKTKNQLTQQEKIQAEVNGILEETKFQSKDAAIYASTYSGKVAQLSQAFTSMKTAIGNVIQPIAKLFIPIVTTAVNVVTRLFTALSGLLSLFGLKADSVETVSSGIGDLANTAGDASDAISDIGDSAKKAGKDAKKASNNLAAFDNLNVLQKDTSSSGGSGGGAGAAAGLTDALDVKSTITEDTSAFDGLIGRMKELAGIFKAGFDISFGDTNFDGILTHLGNIKNTLKDIWTDPEVLGAVNNYINAVIYSWGQTIGAVARIGVNIAEGLLGSIDKYLSQNVDRIKNTLIQIFDLKAEWQRVSGNFYQALGEISDVFKSDTAKQIGANIIAIFANPIMSVSLLFQKFTNDIQALLLQPIIDNASKIKTTIENVMKPIQTFTGTLAEAMTYVGDKWNEVYDQHIHPLMESLKTGLSDTFGKFLDVYNTYVAPFLQRMADKFNELWNTHLKPFVDKVGELVGSIADAVTALWENVLKPVVDWIIQNILPVLVPIFEALWNTICNVFGAITDAIGGIIDTFRGLIDFIVGVFTGDWNKAWEGIKTFFGGIWDAIKGIVSAVWEAIKGIISTAIEIVKGTIQTVFNAIKTIITNIWNQIKSFFSSIWDAIKKLISNAIESIKNTITNVFNAIKQFITETWNNISNTINNVFNGIKNTITSILNAIKTTWTNIWNGIKSTVTNIWNSISTTISNVINTIKTTISNVTTSIKNAWNTVWNGMKTTIENVFNGIWNTIRGVINSILGGVEKMANGVINGINGMIRALNNLSFDVPDWVPGLGGKKFGFNIGTIGTISLPRLAEGTYVKANTPQLAVIGDNKTQGEIVAPENKMMDMVLTAMKMQKELDQSNSMQNGGTITLNFKGDLAQLVRILKPELDNESIRKGTKLVMGGAN